MQCKCFSVIFFFFSSRRRHTRLVSDWSSDVCSSDLVTATLLRGGYRNREGAVDTSHLFLSPFNSSPMSHVLEPAIVRLTRWIRSVTRSEERRVGKEGRSRWSPDH